VSRAHFAQRYSYVVAVNPDLSPKWAASMRDILNDGCGVLDPADSPLTLPNGSVDNSHCRTGATLGVDPATNEKPAAWADDSSSSSPVVLPDGTVIYGGLTFYNTSRGHLFKFSKDGEPLKTFDFGWDVTPAVYPHDGTYSLLTKDNHYFNWDQSPSTFFISRLNANLTPEWSFQSTNTKSCARLADGGSECVDDHPDGFEWCINAPAVDKAGNVLVNSEDGHLYKIDKAGKLADSILLKLALGAAYTPLSVDDQGRVYSLNGGDMFVIGQ
jgi:outer membrane protein assembly factor BamB